MRRFAVIAAGLAVCAVAGCSSSDAAGSGSGASPASPKPSAGSITVFAASSLTGAFTQIAHQFEAAHPGVKVTLSFGPSSGLASQIVNGAPADVFASASATNMQQVVSAGDATGSTNFVRNQMEVAVPPGNPGHVTSVKTLAKPSVKVAVCQPQVPCGVIAAKVFASAGIKVTPVSLEPDVKSVLTKVELGDVDAGMVYVTDVLAAGSKVKGVPIPANVNATTTYPIAALAKSPHLATAQAFEAYVLSGAGQKVLSAAGFLQP